MSKITTGFTWSLIDKFSSQVVSFIISIILARIISPESYGLIAMIQVFLSFAQVVIDSGFVKALIQKNDRKDIDFYTVFIFNLIISVILYIVLFLFAPLIASFYKEPILCNVTRLIGLNLIISSFSIVQRARLTIDLNFKTQAIVGLVSITISGIVGIICAYNGLQVWSLIIQSLVYQFLVSILFISFTKWVPKLMFSWDSFRPLFSFGSKLLLSNIITSVNMNLSNLLIGKWYSPTQLAFYNRGFTFTTMLSVNIESVLINVIYPIECRLQNNREELMKAYYKYLHFSNYIIFPLMVLLAVLSKPLILVLLTEKWLPASTFIVIFSINFMMYAWLEQSGTLLNVIGKSGVNLKATIIKRPLSFLILFATLPFGVEVFCWGSVLGMAIELFISLYFNKKEMQIPIMEQIAKQFDLILSILIMGGCTYLVYSFMPDKYSQLFVSGTIGVICYISLTFLFKMEEKKIYILCWNKTIHLFKSKF